MGLIKSANTPPSLTPFSLADIEHQAKRILLRAQHQAEQLLAGAQAEAETLKQEGREQGLMEGRREGTAEGLEQGKQAGHQQALNEHRGQLQQAMQALTAVITSLDTGRADLDASALAEVVQLSIAIARRVTKRQGMIDPGVLTANLKDAMRLVIDSSDVRIAIHPEQRATLDAALPELRMQWPNLARVHVLEDASLEQGGCRVFTEHGLIDAGLSGQLDRIAAELLPSVPLSAPSGSGNSID